MSEPAHDADIRQVRSDDAAFAGDDVTDVPRTFAFVEAPAFVRVTGNRLFLGAT